MQVILHMQLGASSSYLSLFNLDERPWRIFNRALMVHPDLDIALVNMGNTLKDSVRLGSHSACRRVTRMVTGPAVGSNSILPAGDFRKS